MEKRYTITLSDGTELSGLALNGNNFISTEEVTEETFEGKLTEVTISDGETEEIIEDAELIQISTLVPGEWWFIIRKIPEDVMRERRMQANIEYIAMMADVDLDEGEV